MMRKDRKGFIGDAAFLVGILVFLGVMWIVSANIFSSLNDSLQTSDVLDNDSKAAVAGLEGRYVSLFDGLFLLVFGLLAVALIVSTAMLGTRPEFFFITIIVAIFLIGGAAAAANVYGNVSGGVLGATAAEFTFIPLIMNNLVTVTLLLVGLLLGGLYVKARGLI